MPFSFDRRDPGPNDVVVDIAYCGICHSDIHQARDEWGNAIYPMVPGHEIVGTSARSASVKKFKEGDLAGVGVHGRLLPRLRQLQRRRGAATARRAWSAPTTRETTTAN